MSEEISYEPHGRKYFSRQTSHKLHWNIQYNLHLIAIISDKNQFLSSKLREKKLSHIKLVWSMLFFLTEKNSDFSTTYHPLYCILQVCSKHLF